MFSSFFLLFSYGPDIIHIFYVNCDLLDLLVQIINDTSYQQQPLLQHSNKNNDSNSKNTAFTSFARFR